MSGITSFVYLCIPCTIKNHIYLWIGVYSKGLTTLGNPSCLRRRYPGLSVICCKCSVLYCKCLCLRKARLLYGL